MEKVLRPSIQKHPDLDQHLTREAMLTQLLTHAGVQKYYTVKEGDSLANIASEFNTTVQAIQSANPSITNVNQIAIGEIFAIPAATTGKLSLCVP